MISYELVKYMSIRDKLLNIDIHYLSLLQSNIDIDDKVDKVNSEQYLPYLLHRDQLPSEGEAAPHPISDNNRPNREHLFHSMMKVSNCEYNMSQ